MCDLDREESVSVGQGDTGYTCSPVVTSLGQVPELECTLDAS